MSIVQRKRGARPFVWMRRLCIVAGVFLILIGIYLGISEIDMAERSEDAAQEQKDSIMLILE
ncbi:MAG: hypothetical protein ACOYI4_01610 [Christensenellales bacterium]|jgi:hypothetical protein